MARFGVQLLHYNINRYLFFQKFIKPIQSKFQCKCHPGFVVQSDGSCLDVNECLKSSSNPCEYGMKCVNTPGSYFCKANEVCQVDEADYYRKVKGYSRLAVYS